ncbi:COG0780 Enzyme related to GTP cyclohydrolase I [uncultured Caudovirales phage]|uniref:COG0780 Enzyme related to GTP cyclohydrolase I n=1 Tax=uncultured Caudovirales phage TaxID=2100421 RepID=A0A6J5PD32_9CAUD|nr:COG0780 Enzyme related to GTP cyclohydrolase I [uncultured Caudovirales phage]CAB5226711.1 COG0780 Enzyme related to GTP cyclohydrolase I [uncultured Caudovirales phage]
MTTLKNLKQSAENKTLYEQLINGEMTGFEVLERFPKPESLFTNSLSLNLVINEFTSLCPVTGQPDFATIEIDYIVNEWCVESKALKLYMLSYRNKRDFHEACVTTILNDLVTLLDPIYIRVIGKFYPRGGIPFHPTVEYFREG